MGEFWGARLAVHWDFPATYLFELSFFGLGASSAWSYFAWAGPAAGGQSSNVHEEVIGEVIPLHCMLIFYESYYIDTVLRLVHVVGVNRAFYRHPKHALKGYKYG